MRAAEAAFELMSVGHCD